MAALFVLALAVLGPVAASTTTEGPQDAVMKIDEVSISAPFADVRPPPPPPPVQPQDAPDPIPAMVFFLPSSHPRRPDYPENSYLGAAPFRPVPAEDTYQTKYTAAQNMAMGSPGYYGDSYRPQGEDSFGRVPQMPISMGFEMQHPYHGVEKPLNRDLMVNYNRPPYPGYPEQTDAVEPIQDEVPPPPPQQKPIDFSANNEEEEQQQPEAPANDVMDADAQNRPVRQEVEDENQDDNQEEVVPALVFFLKKKGITNDYKLFHNKDEVGIPGKANRFRRSPGSSGGFSHSSASSSSSSSSGDPLYFGGGSNSFSQSSASSSSGSGGGGIGAPYGVDPPSFGHGNNGGGGYNTGYGGGGGGDDLLNRFGASDDNKPFTVQHSGTSTGKGVHSSASSSIDNTGKVTYSVQAGRH